MKFNKHYEVPLKAKATGCPGPLTVTRMLNYKDAIEKQQVQKQVKLLSGLTWQQIPEFIQHKNGLSSRAGNNITGMWERKTYSSYRNYYK